MTHVGTKLPLRSDQYTRIEDVVIDAFVHGKPYTQRALAQAMAVAFGVDEDDTATGMVYYLRKLASRGMYEAQAGRFGSKGTQAKGSPTSPRWFNFSNLAVDDATFRHALEPFLADADVASWRRETIRKAIRFARDLPTQCADDRILEAAGHIAADQLYGLPDAVFMQAMERFTNQTAKNYRSAVSVVLEYAARRRLIPMVFPYFHKPDAWAEFTNRFFPLAEQGESSGYVKRHRNGMSYIRRAAVALYGDDVLPEEISRTRCEEIRDRLRVVDGDIPGATRAMCTMRELAQAFGIGPFAEKSAADAFFVQTPSGMRPAIHLRSPSGESRRDDWDGLLLMLEEYGFPDDTIAFLRWYKIYITMPARELLSNENRTIFPSRRNAHRLCATSLKRRCVSLRAYLGTAVNLLGMRPAELTPGVLFGSSFDVIAYALVDWWQSRRDAFLAEGRDTAIAGGLGHYIIGIGMMCFTRYELLRFNRRLSVAVTDKESAKKQGDRTVRIDTWTEEASEKTPEEQSAWDAYRSSYGIANNLQGIVKDERGANRAGTPEFKDIKEMMRNTPPQWFITILNRSIEQVRTGMRRKQDNAKFHKLVRDTVDLAFHISTGCRSEESCLVRMDVHLTPERLAKRVVFFRAGERKNNKDQEVILQPAYLPDDILEFYLARTRPFLMRDQYVRPHRIGGKGKKVSQPELVQTHPFFLVTSRGTSYGVEDLKSETSVIYLAQRAEEHGRNLTVFLARSAVRCGLKLSGRKYELGPHAIRGVFAYALYVMTGSAQAAAHYLGDEEDTVTNNYSAISGIHVDSSALIGFRVGPVIGGSSVPTLEPPASAGLTGSNPVPEACDRDVEAAYLKRLEELRADRRAGLIDAEEFAELKTAYRRQYRLKLGMPERSLKVA
ncbi:MAG TPA: hypothetical protein VFK04_13740 [Gemmatimonadaceae bacterium]|nr:hypothetical protein [Gemmatimonadaceae bacterium]